MQTCKHTFLDVAGIIEAKHHEYRFRHAILDGLKRFTLSFMSAARSNANLNALGAGRDEASKPHDGLPRDYIEKTASYSRTSTTLRHNSGYQTIICVFRG